MQKVPALTISIGSSTLLERELPYETTSAIPNTTFFGNVTENSTLPQLIVAKIKWELFNSKLYSVSTLWYCLLVLVVVFLIFLLFCYLTNPVYVAPPEVCRAESSYIANTKSESNRLEVSTSNLRKFSNTLMPTEDHEDLARFDIATIIKKNTAPKKQTYPKLRVLSIERTKEQGKEVLFRGLGVTSAGSNFLFDEQANRLSKDIPNQLPQEQATGRFSESSSLSKAFPNDTIKVQAKTLVEPPKELPKVCSADLVTKAPLKDSIAAPVASLALPAVSSIVSSKEQSTNLSSIQSKDNDSFEEFKSVFSDFAKDDLINQSTILSKDQSSVISNITSKEQSSDISKEISKNQSIVVPKETLKKQTTVALKEISKDQTTVAPKEISKDKSTLVPTEILKDQSTVVSKETSKDQPKESSKDKFTDAPKEIFKAKSTVVPKETLDKFIDVKSAVLKIESKEALKIPSKEQLAPLSKDSSKDLNTAQLKELIPKEVFTKFFKPEDEILKETAKSMEKVSKESANPKEEMLRKELVKLNEELLKEPAKPKESTQPKVDLAKEATTKPKEDASKKVASPKENIAKEPVKPKEELPKEPHTKTKEAPQSNFFQNILGSFFVQSTPQPQPIAKENETGKLKVAKESGSASNESNNLKHAKESQPKPVLPVNFRPVAKEAFNPFEERSDEPATEDTVRFDETLSFKQTKK